jgi:arylsulfatase A-like enzyme
MIRFDILKGHISEVWKRYRVALTIALIGGLVNGYLQKLPIAFVDAPIPTLWGKLLLINAVFLFYSDISLATSLSIFFPFILIDYIYIRKNKERIDESRFVKILIYVGLFIVIFATGYGLNIDPRSGISGLLLTKRLMIISVITIFIQIGILFFLRRFVCYIFKILIITFVLSSLIYSGSFIYMPCAGIDDYNQTNKSDRPSIILVVEDALNTRYLTPYFPENGITPNFDSLTGDCILFKNCISQSPWTVPSIASIWSGLPPTANSVDRNNPYLLVDSLPGILSENGYRTYAVVCTPLITHNFGYASGFDHYYLIDKERLVDYGLDMPIGSMTQWEKFISKFSRFISGLFHNRLRQVQWNIAMKAVEKLPKNGAFLYIHIMDTHLPYNPVNKFREGGYDYKGRFRNSIDVNDLSKYRDGLIKIDDESERGYIKMLYRGEVRGADYILGRLVDILKGRDIFDDIAFIYTADHGEEHWEHNDFEHGHSVHREVVWVPLIMHIPGIESGVVVNSQVRLMDLFPTILDIASVNCKKEILAEDLIPLINKSISTDLPAISEKLLYNDEKVSFRDGQYTYIIEMKDGSEYLYNNWDEDRVLNDTLIKEKMAILLKEYLSKELEIRKSRIDYAMGEINESDKEYIKESLRSLGYVH